MKYGANKTDEKRALKMLLLNGLTQDQALDLKNQAEAKKGEMAFGYGCWMTAHTDGTYSSGAA